MTLYRIGSHSPIPDLLIEAADAGKQVAVLVELKARFDERSNIGWANRLEEAGVHVVYGLLNLKTHCKLCLVVRQGSNGVERYAHIGTGNYNAATVAGLHRSWPAHLRAAPDGRHLRALQLPDRVLQSGAVSRVAGGAARPPAETAGAARTRGGSRPRRQERRASSSRSTGCRIRASSEISIGPRARACRSI